MLIPRRKGKAIEDVAARFFVVLLVYRIS